MPVGLRQLFFYKWLFGLAAVVLPLALGEILCYILLPVPHFGAQASLFFSSALLTVISAGNIYAWTVALCIRAAKEHRVALTAAMVIALGLLVRQPPDWNIPELRDIEFLIRLAVPINVSDRLLTYAVSPRNLLITLVLQSGLIAVLYYWASRRFGLDRPVRPPEALQLKVTLGTHRFRPRRNPILWKTWKEISWIWSWYVAVSFALMIAVGIYSQYELLYGGRYLYESWNGRGYPADLARELPDLTATVISIYSYVGLFFVIVVGVEIGMGDFERGVDGFWRSRPIESKAYFGRRFLTGWVVSMIALLLPMLFVRLNNGAQHATFRYLHQDQYSRFIGLTNEPMQIVSDVTWYVIPLLSAVYAMSAMFGAFIRRRVVAMVATAAVLICTVGFGWELVRSAVGILRQIALEQRWPWISICLWLLVTLLFGWFAQLGFQGDWKEKISVFLHTRNAANLKAHQA